MLGTSKNVGEHGRHLQLAEEQVTKTTQSFTMAFLDGGPGYDLVHKPHFLRPLPNQVRTRQQRIMPTPWSVTSDPADKEKLDEADNGCIITNIHRHTDQRAHIINAQLSGIDRHNDVVRLSVGSP